MSKQQVSWKTIYIILFAILCPTAIWTSIYLWCLITGRSARDIWTWCRRNPAAAYTANTTDQTGNPHTGAPSPSDDSSAFSIELDDVTTPLDTPDVQQQVETLSTPDTHDPDAIVPAPRLLH